MPLTALAAVLLGGCAHYAARPVDQAGLAGAFRARTLDDSVVVAAVTARAGAPGANAWSAAQFAVAAQVRHTDVAEAAAALEVARAGEITAGARPQPGVSGEFGRATDPGPFESPWFGSVMLSVKIELGGKRGARIAAARARTARAAVDLAGAEWNVAHRAHAAHGAVLAADSLAVVLDGERARRGAVLGSLRRRVEAGEVSTGELARLASEQATLEVELQRVVAAREAARQELARALAVPRVALDPVHARPDSIDGCAVTRSVETDELEARALTQRPEVGRALADYAEAEAVLRLEVARTWPDLVLGPGFVWDGGVHRWNLFASLPELMLNRNRGPIAEAVARRAAAGVRVDAAQQAVLADVAAARAACAGALRELATADSAATALARAAAVVREAVERGERGERDRLAMELVQARAQRERLGAAVRVREAGIGLERAVGRWLAEPGPTLDSGRERTP